MTTENGYDKTKKKLAGNPLCHTTWVKECWCSVNSCQSTKRSMAANFSPFMCKEACSQSYRIRAYQSRTYYRHFFLVGTERRIPCRPYFCKKVFQDKHTYKGSESIITIMIERTDKLLLCCTLSWRWVHAECWITELTEKERVQNEVTYMYVTWTQES